MKIDAHFAGGDFHLGWHVQQIPKDLPGLGISITPHLPGDQPIKCKRCAEHRLDKSDGLKKTSVICVIVGDYDTYDSLIKRH
ncbi:MAG: hypothetical protein PHV34_04975 [Verrucomicrobiae bacterium]|nr:hypothetical protein [Verrucomicrobiae bacterium]